MLDKVENRGIEKGIVKGESCGENKMALLVKKLFEQNRIDDEQKKLSEEQISRLEMIGMQWGSRYDRQWNEVYQAAKRYFDAYGNLDVPVAYISPEGYALGKWVRRQQYAHRNPQKSNAILSPERIKRLESIGMQWDKPDPWQHRYKLAQDYKKEHGNLEIPAKYKTADGIWLGRWIYDQKRMLRDGSEKLSVSQKNYWKNCWIQQEWKVN